MAKKKPDHGKHYRFTYKKKLTKKDIKKGFTVIKLDPFRISAIYHPMSFATETALKKILCSGNRGAKDYKQDIEDSICALQRELEIINEDEFNNS